jgi:hypothetical protein
MISKLLYDFLLTFSPVFFMIFQGFGMVHQLIEENPFLREGFLEKESSENNDNLRGHPHGRKKNKLKITSIGLNLWRS